MNGFDTYVVVTSVTVFALLTALFAYLIVRDVKNSLKMLAAGLNDHEIMTREIKQAARKRSRALRVADVILTVSIIAVATCAFVLSLSVKFNENRPVGNIPALKVVASGSMATKFESNDYLVENDLNDQIGRFDLIAVEKLPPEEELKLYDVVIYETDGYLIVHRIVGITEPDEKHSERYFLMQGDANQYPDKFPVRYTQMRGIYRGKHVPYIGSFVSFMHSPAGYLCFALVIFASAAYPIITKKLNAVADKRLAEIGFSVENIPSDETKTEQKEE